MRNPWLIRLSEPNNPKSSENHPWFELVQVAGSEEKVGMYTSDFEGGYHLKDLEMISKSHRWMM